jgi:RNA polymerase sigma-70 factor (ECF subfamily)
VAEKFLENKENDKRGDKMLFILFGVLTDEQRDLIEQIFREHHIQFQRISFKIVKSESAANDAVSAAYLKIIDNIEKISDLPCPLMTAFCVTIVKNSSIDMIRRSKKYAHLESLDYLKDESVEKFEDIYINKANIQRLSELIDELSQEERELIQLRYAQDMGYAEIGALLDITEEAAKKRGQRVVKKLKKLFGEG